MIDISVIVPVYNVEKYLVGCIESILHQTFKGTYEVILVDDGSTDGSGEICDLYSEQCKVIHQPNRGVSAARNVGIRAAQGEYLSFVDSDDTLREYALEKLWQRVVEHPDVDVVVGQITGCGGFRPSVKMRESYSNNKQFIRSQDVWSVLGSSVYPKLLRTKILIKNEIFFWEEIDCGEDVLWMFFLHKYINSIAWCYEDTYDYNETNALSILHSANIFSHQVNRLRIGEIMASNISKDIGEYRERCQISYLFDMVPFIESWSVGEHKRLRQAARHAYKELRKCHAGFYLCYKAWLLTVPIPPKVTFWLSRPFTWVLRVCFV